MKVLSESLEGLTLVFGEFLAAFCLHYNANYLIFQVRILHKVIYVNHM